MTATVEISPLQWASIADADDVRPIGEHDADCLAAIRDVLKKHGMQDRFGIALLHKHFEMSSDEILLEQNDVENRTLTIHVVKANDELEAVGTIYRFNVTEMSPVMGCIIDWCV